MEEAKKSLLYNNHSIFPDKLKAIPHKDSAADDNCPCSKRLDI